MPVPHQPPNNIPLASSLPKVSFRKIPAKESQQLLTPAGVQDQQHINFGFNDGSEFEKPEHYLRYVEPIESELNKQVEYDMDEQDQEWLDALNIERRRDQQDAISYEVFEIIIDRLEKEWFDLMKRIPVKPTPLIIGKDGQPVEDGSEDIECAICDDGECENSNAIVFCDGCNLAVHQDCYGIPYIPEGQWLCRKCTVSPDRAVSCVLCPHEGGAFKQTTQGKWAHLLCAMWIPETGVSNPVYMEPIDSVERIPKARWRLQCYLCKHKMGACIQCDNKNCFTAFHVTCARRNGLLLKSQRQRISHSQDLDSDEEDSSEVLRAWCHKHVPRSLRTQKLQQRDEEEEDEDTFQDASSQLRSLSPPNPKKGTSQGNNVAAPGRKKSARAYKKSYRSGPTLVPVFVINRVLDHISRVHIRKKLLLTIQIAKFWSLKREARRGAPLLKRLHLEPWTASTSNKEQSDAERIKKLQFLLRLREDLEKVRMLAELVRKREKEKLRQVQVIRSTLVDGVLFPYHDSLRKALERVSALDRTSLFLHPVSPQKVPDYYDIIKRPMDWTSIAAKIDDFQYTCVAEFKQDMHLVLDNAMLYNKIDTPYHRTAARIKKVAEPIFEDLQRLNGIHGEKSDLHLEAEESIIELLQDVTEEERVPSMDGSQNAIEELTRYFYFAEFPAANEDKNQVVPSRMSAQARKTAEKAARSERSRLAALKRKEEKEAQAAETSATSVMIKSSGSNRHLTRHSGINTNSAEAGQKKRRRQDAAAEEESNEDESGDESLEPGKLEVEQVSNFTSFQKFNTGWVLPTGSKRSRATQRYDPNKIRLPSEQVAVNQEESQRENTSDLSELEEEEEEAVGSTSQRRTRSNRETTSHKRRRTTSSATSVDHSRPLIRGPDGKFARVEKSNRRRNDSNEETKREEQNRRRREARRKKKTKGEFEPSTLCWAKLEGHPCFPAEIFEEDSKLVPSRVLEDKKRSPSIDEVVFLVRFFDATRSFGWIPSSKLKLLFEDEELDQQMLKASRKSGQRKAVKAGYERAKAEVDF